MTDVLKEFKQQEYEEKKEKIDMTIWDELKDMVKDLEHLTYPQIKNFVDTYMEDEKKELVDKFNETFKDIEDTDPLKIEVLALLGRIGVEVYA